MTPGKGHVTQPDHKRLDETLVRPDQRPSPTHLSLALTCSKESPGVARHALRCWLEELECPRAVADDAVLVTSELVTNAVVHAASAAQLRATLHAGRLRLEVYDDSVEPPRPRDSNETAGGYGLQFVASIADDWGWSPTQTGKLVWAEHLDASQITTNTPSLSARRR